MKYIDLSGRIVKQFTTKGASENIAILQKGVYVLSVTTQDGKTLTKKMAKE